MKRFLITFLAVCVATLALAQDIPQPPAVSPKILNSNPPTQLTQWVNFGNFYYAKSKTQATQIATLQAAGNNSGATPQQVAALNAQIASLTASNTAQASQIANLNSQLTAVNNSGTVASVTATLNQILTKVTNIETLIGILKVPTAPGQTTAVIAWNFSGTGNQGFIVERSTDGSNWNTIGTVAAGLRKYSDTSIAAGTTYWYRVRATYPNNVSSATNITGVTFP